MPTLQGQTALILQVHREGHHLYIQAEGANKPWRVLLRGVKTVASVSGGTGEIDEQGLLLIPADGNSHLMVHLL